MAIYLLVGSWYCGRKDDNVSYFIMIFYYYCSLITSISQTDECNRYRLNLSGIQSYTMCS